MQLANLESLAVYFDTESPSMAGMPLADSIKKFKSLVGIFLMVVAVLSDHKLIRLPTTIRMQATNLS